ncbi:MAG: hypothetical protein PVF58_14105 [Candidatus Methanofastidiosia archaeon]|jgi:hypothetical protein
MLNREDLILFIYCARQVGFSNRGETVTEDELGEIVKNVGVYDLHKEERRKLTKKEREKLKYLMTKTYVRRMLVRDYNFHVFEQSKGIQVI